MKGSEMSKFTKEQIVNAKFHVMNAAEAIVVARFAQDDFHFHFWSHEVSKCLEQAVAALGLRLEEINSNAAAEPAEKESGLAPAPSFRHGFDAAS
jgi:hypothetical protein